MNKLPKLSKAKAIELNPDKKYIIVVSNEDFTQEDAHLLSDWLRKNDIKHVVVNVRDAKDMKVIEA